jgi:transposase-like protein
MPAARKLKGTIRKSVRKAKPRKRHSPAEREKILADAKAAKLTGKQVAEKYGISTLTYYLWRKKAGSGGRKAPGKNGTLTSAAESKLRSAVRAKVTGLLPRILDEEVERILGRWKNR